MDFLNDKNILIYGPANENLDKDIQDLFPKFDFILVNNHMFELILELLKDIEKQKYKFIRILNGHYVDVYGDLIKKRDELVCYYFVSEVHTKGVLMNNNNINPNKILPLANNYRNYGFNRSLPQMIPKTLIAFSYYKCDFKLLKITGVTFYMDYNGKKPCYNLNYSVGIARDYWQDISENLTDEEIYKDYLKRHDDMRKDGRDDTHDYKEGYNFFLRFLYKHKDKVKLDKTLKKIVRENPTLFKI